MAAVGLLAVAEEHGVGLLAQLEVLRSPPIAALRPSGRTAAERHAVRGEGGAFRARRGGVLERWERVTGELMRAKAGSEQQADWAKLFRAAHVLRRLESRHARLMRAALQDGRLEDPGGAAAAAPPGAEGDGFRRLKPQRRGSTR